MGCQVLCQRKPFVVLPLFFVLNVCLKWMEKNTLSDEKGIDYLFNIQYICKVSIKIVYKAFGTT